MYVAPAPDERDTRRAPAASSTATRGTAQYMCRRRPPYVLQLLVDVPSAQFSCSMCGESWNPAKLVAFARSTGTSVALHARTPGFSSVMVALSVIQPPVSPSR